MNQYSERYLSQPSSASCVDCSLRDGAIKPYERQVPGEGTPRFTVIAVVFSTVVSMSLCYLWIMAMLPAGMESNRLSCTAERGVLETLLTVQVGLGFGLFERQSRIAASENKWIRMTTYLLELYDDMFVCLVE